MPALKDVIAKAIKDADSSYFFEDYNKQADQVIRALQQHYALLPKEPNEAMIQAGKHAISFGATKPTELVKNIYVNMIKAYKA